MFKETSKDPACVDRRKDFFRQSKQNFVHTVNSLHKAKYRTAQAKRSLHPSRAVFSDSLYCKYSTVISTYAPLQRFYPIDVYGFVFETPRGSC